MMRRRVISCVAMSGLAVATLLSVVGASSSAGTLPGRPASAEVLEETTARVVGTCTNAIGPTANCAVNLSAAGYCQTTYGAPPVPFGAGGCNAAGGVARPCGSCTGALHVNCVGNLAATFKCCNYVVQCCSPPNACTTVGLTCGCVATPAMPIMGNRLACYSCPLAFTPPAGAPCVP